MALATRKPDRRTEADELEVELTALRAERDAICAEVIHLRNLITYAFGQDRWDIALGVRDRLANLGSSLQRRAAA